MLCSKGKVIAKVSTYNSQLDTALRYGAVKLDITVRCVVKGKGKVLDITASWILRYGTERHNWIYGMVGRKGQW
jgi:hypothetical protein